MKFVFVKGGCFQMGDTFGDGGNNEKPVHQVCINDFYIGKYEVTQAQYQKIMGTNPSVFKTCGPNCPVDSVSWDDSQAFVGRLAQQSGKKFRLPYEAEWEYAARSGGKNEEWAGTSDLDELGDYAWFRDNSDTTTHPVGQKQPNGLGIYDMTGNIWEWCMDRYDEKYYEKSPQKNPHGALTGTYRVLRGGCWNFTAGLVRAAYRYEYSPYSRHYFFGFRIVLPAVQGRFYS